jgi:DNA-binding transcriptional ArsR family regulator
MAPPPEPRIARVAAMIADPARSRMLCRLLSGEHATAGELARAATVTPATASGHLARLLDAGLVRVQARGRHRYFQLADAEVAHALEALALVAERGDAARGWASSHRQTLRHARCCYGHLAGTLGVRLMQALLSVQGLQPDGPGLTLTAPGRAWLATLDFDVPAPQPRRRYAYACMDWSERQDHLAGQLADALLAHLLHQGWLRRDEGRALAVTPRGTQQLLPRLGPPPAA